MTAPAQSSATRIVHRSCPTCEASCGLRIEIDPARQSVIRIEGDPDDVDQVIGAKVTQVREAIDALLQRGLAERKHVFW